MKGRKNKIKLKVLTDTFPTQDLHYTQSGGQTNECKNTKQVYLHLPHLTHMVAAAVPSRLGQLRQKRMHYEPPVEATRIMSITREEGNGEENEQIARAYICLDTTHGPLI